MLGKVVVAGAVSAALVIGVAPSASAEVGYDRPKRDVCRGQAVKFGVWHKPGTGGPRKVGYILRKPGRGSFRGTIRAKNRRSYYKYTAKRTGVYSLILTNGGAVRFRTRVHSC